MTLWKRYYIKASSRVFCVTVQRISASCDTSNTMRVRRSPEGYINNVAQVWRLHCIWVEVERSLCVHVCVCAYEFFIPEAWKLTWIPRLFLTTQSSTHKHAGSILNTQMTLDEGMEVKTWTHSKAALRFESVYSGKQIFSFWRGWTLRQLR